jgi:hypothetical protein
MNLQLGYLRLALWAVAWSLTTAGDLTTVGVLAVGVQNLQTVLVPSSTITTPPNPRVTESCAAPNNIFKRDTNSTVYAPSCEFGGCGTSCLAQGAFCCNPGTFCPRLP